MATSASKLPSSPLLALSSTTITKQANVITYTFTFLSSLNLIIDTLVYIVIWFTILSLITRLQNGDVRIFPTKISAAAFLLNIFFLFM
jgi:hypothetical protein